MGMPEMDGLFITNNPIKKLLRWMIWGYPDLWKPPCIREYCNSIETEQQIPVAGPPNVVASGANFAAALELRAFHMFSARPNVSSGEVLSSRWDGSEP